MAKVSQCLEQKTESNPFQPLKGLGIEVTISRAELQLAENRSKANTSYLKIRKIPPEPPEPPVSENHEENPIKNRWRHFNYWRHYASAGQKYPQPKIQRITFKTKDW